jgi:hypothetical protein
MPRREDIERFAQVLNSLGDEPAIRAARSESIEDVAHPAEEGNQRESDQLDTLPFDTGTAEQESMQDIFAGLEGLPGDETPPGQGSEESPALEEPSTPPSAPSGDEIDFSSLFGDESAVSPSIEEIEKPAPRKSGRPPKPAEEEVVAPLEATPSDEDAFSFPGGEPESLQADLSQMEVLPESQGEEPAEPVIEPAGEESFELPSLDDLSFTEPAGEPLPPSEPSEPFGPSEVPAEPFGPSEVPAEPEPEQPVSPAPEELPASVGFDLDAASFEMPGSEPGEAAPEPEQGAEAAAEPGMDSLGEESLGELNLDEFSLPESAEQFGLPEPAQAAPKPRPAPARPRPERVPKQQPARPAPAGAAVEPGVIELTPEQFAQLKRTLDSLPRNLKIAVQDLIGQGMVSGADLSTLITLLLQGASAQDIATLTGRITGKRIRVPAGYEKKTGVALEEEQRTFGYAFRENILPILRIVAITLVAGGLFGYLGYSYVYKPLSAYTNYRAGYAQIKSDHYALANERFERAVRAWQMKSWYYRYAEAFADKHQTDLAEQKYDALLAWQPNDKKGILDYARMESRLLARFDKADSLIARILARSMYDYDALLASGDNHLDWAEHAAGQYEKARLSYATLIERYGTRDELLFRMLRLFIRTDQGDEVERLRLYYAARPDVKIDAGVFAELGGYLVDHRKLDFVQEVLFRADKAQKGLYEVHYNLARYYRLVKDKGDEKKALDATVENLKRSSGSDALLLKRLTIEIDTWTRLGEYNYDNREYLTAETNLRRAVSLVEQYQKIKLIPRSTLYGRPYAALGDLYYYIQGDMNASFAQYQSALANLYTSPELIYKIGYIQYRQEDYKAALGSFTIAEDASAYPAGTGEAPGAEAAAIEPMPIPGQPPLNLLYALGNCFYQRGDYFAAQGCYLRVLDRLENRRAALGILHPEDQPSDRALLDSLVRVNNNLGITMYKLSQRTGDRTRRSVALVYFTKATEIADTLARSPDTVIRSENRSLPSLNMHGILYPLSGYVLQPFAALPKDFEAISW